MFRHTILSSMNKNGEVLLPFETIKMTIQIKKGWKL